MELWTTPLRSDFLTDRYQVCARECTFKWHSDPWPTVTSQPIRLSTNFMTLIPSLTFTDYEWFPWSICNGCGMPAGKAYPSGHLVPSPILGLADAPIVETKFLELAMSLLDFSPRIPLGTFSILLQYKSYTSGCNNWCLHCILKGWEMNSKFQYHLTGSSNKFTHVKFQSGNSPVWHDRLSSLTFLFTTWHLYSLFVKVASIYLPCLVI